MLKCRKLLSKTAILQLEHRCRMVTYGHILRGVRRWGLLTLGEIMRKGNKARPCRCGPMAPAWPACCAWTMEHCLDAPPGDGGMVNLGNAGGGGETSETTRGFPITPTSREQDGKWIKGYSANPGGQTNEQRLAKAMAKKASIEAMGLLIAIMRSPKAKLHLRKEAALELLDRGLGKVAIAKDDGQDDEIIDIEFDSVELDKMLENQTEDDSTEGK